MNIGQTDLNPPVTGQINACDSQHINYLLILRVNLRRCAIEQLSPASLWSLVLGLLANHVQHALAPDDLALWTAALDRCFHFHSNPPG
jgi:hypothetical protein